jgi:CheY-like chemotaxis protein
MDARLPVLLLVDDDPDIRSVLVSYFTPLGWQCLEADNGVDALALVGAADAQIVDYRMPLMDGDKYIQELQRRGIIKPTVVLTGLLEDIVMPDNIVCLRKPFSHKDILDAIACAIVLTNQAITRINYPAY